MTVGTGFPGCPTQMLQEVIIPRGRSCSEKLVVQYGVVYKIIPGREQMSVVNPKNELSVRKRLYSGKKLQCNFNIICCIQIKNVSQFLCSSAKTKKPAQFKHN